MTESEQAARAALDAFFTCWNAADVEALRATLNYPFITLGPAGQTIIAAEPSAFTTDFAQLREREGWHHSTLDAVDAVFVSEGKVHCVATYSRYHADGACYATGTILYIVTRQNGHWGMQLRSSMDVARPGQ
jgi:hypothetical protein